MGVWLGGVPFVPPPLPGDFRGGGELLEKIPKTLVWAFVAKFDILCPSFFFLPRETLFSTPSIYHNPACARGQ